MLAARAFLLTGTPPPPTVTGISPTYFYTARWVGFTITGTNFIPGATTVSFAPAGANVTGISVNAAGTSLTVSMYAASAGTAAVSVTTPGGTATSQSITAAVEPPPTPYIYGFTPSYVPPTGGTFTASGYNFSLVTYVTVGGYGVSYSVNSDSSITISGPNLGSGSKAVTLYSNNGNVTAYIAYGSPPSISSISPSSASASTNRTAYGSGFAGTGTLYLLIDSFAYGTVVSYSDTAITWNASGVGPGTYTLKVYTGFGGTGWINGPTFTVT